MQGSIDFSGVLSGSVTGEGGGGAVPVVTANATVDANTGTPSCDVTRTGTDLNPNFTFNFKNIKGATGSAGSPGQNGTDGTDGVSPGVSISNITNGHRVTITDATHPSGQVFDVMNGANGIDGTNGTNGTNGVSPTVAITDITDGHRVTITDATHPSGQSFDVMDGEKGDTGQTGPQGQTGPVGPGVNPGGSTGMILYKASNADYDTAWGDIPSYTAPQITYDPTGRVYISDTDVQGALDEVDSELSTLNSSLTQIMPLQSGVKTGVSLAANGQTEVNITLPTPYLGGGTSYAVIASIVIWSSADKFPYVVRDKGQASFTLRVYNATSSTATVEIDWITVPVTPTT